MKKEAENFYKSETIIENCVASALEDNDLWKDATRIGENVRKSILGDGQIQTLCGQIDTVLDFISKEEEALVRQENRLVKTLRCYGIIREVRGFSPWNTLKDVVTARIIKGAEDMEEYTFEGDDATIFEELDFCIDKLLSFYKYFDESLIKSNEDIASFNHINFLRSDNNLKISTARHELLDLTSRKSLFKKPRIKCLQHSLKQYEEAKGEIDQKYSALMAKDEVRNYAEFSSHAGLFKAIKKFICNEEYSVLEDDFNSRYKILQEAKNNYSLAKTFLEELVINHFKPFCNVHSEIKSL